jgi:hypothetical protein
MIRNKLEKVSTKNNLTILLEGWGCQNMIRVFQNQSKGNMEYWLSKLRRRFISQRTPCTWTTLRVMMVTWSIAAMLKIYLQGWVSTQMFKRIGGCSSMEVYEVSRKCFWMATTFLQRSLLVIFGHLGNQMTQWNKVWS